MQTLFSHFGDSEIVMQTLFSHFGDSEIVMQTLFDHFRDSETIMQALLGHFGDFYPISPSIRNSAALAGCWIFLFSPPLRAKGGKKIPLKHPEHPIFSNYVSLPGEHTGSSLLLPAYG